jgi:hypothetical protein
MAELWKDKENKGEKGKGERVNRGEQTGKDKPEKASADRLRIIHSLPFTLSPFPSSLWKGSYVKPNDS